MTTQSASAVAEPPAAEQLHCCYIGEHPAGLVVERAESADSEGGGCPKPAEYEIIDMADYTETCITHACTEHVGPLLGHADHLDEDAENRWEVRAL